jgi:CcmD family protein
MPIDPILEQIYQLVVPSLPYVIGAYAALWLGLMVYVGVTLSRLGKLEKQLALVEDVLAKRG